MARRLRCSASLWSADLSRLAEEIRRVEPYCERFHLDAADGRLVGTMLFFPDLVAALRPHTKLPFEVHLITRDPMAWVEPFVSAGADIVIFYPGTGSGIAETIAAIREAGALPGISLALGDDPGLLDPFWPQLDTVTVVGTEIGIKGADMDPAVPGRIRRCRDAIDGGGHRTLVEADGGIRRHTVPLIAAAGADYIVPGSLMFGEDPARMRAWLETLQA